MSSPPLIHKISSRHGAKNDTPGDYLTQKQLGRADYAMSMIPKSIRVE